MSSATPTDKLRLQFSQPLHFASPKFVVKDLDDDISCELLKGGEWDLLLEEDIMDFKADYSFASDTHPTFFEFFRTAGAYLVMAIGVVALIALITLHVGFALICALVAVGVFFGVKLICRSGLKSYQVWTVGMKYKDRNDAEKTLEVFRTTTEEDAAALRLFLWRRVKGHLPSRPAELSEPQEDALVERGADVAYQTVWGAEDPEGLTRDELVVAAKYFDANRIMASAAMICAEKEVMPTGSMRGDPSRWTEENWRWYARDRGIQLPGDEK